MGDLTMKMVRLILTVIGLALVLTACQEEAVEPTRPVTLAAPSAEIVMSGLLNPVGIEVLADGTLLVAEEGTGEDDLSAGVTVRLPGGQTGRLLSDFPSSRDAHTTGAPSARVSDASRSTCRSPAYCRCMTT